MRLIDADALLAEYDRQHVGEPGRARKLIEDAPTIDAEPVRHGRWIEEQEPISWCEDDVEVNYVCSACKESIFVEWEYCPNCGAKMDGGAFDEC